MKKRVPRVKKEGSEGEKENWRVEKTRGYKKGLKGEKCCPLDI